MDPACARRETRRRHQRTNRRDRKLAAATCFSELERLVLQFTDEVNANVKGSRATLEGLKRHLSPGEIIELLIIIGHWRQTATILETTEVDLEDFAGQYNILSGTRLPLTAV